LCISRLYSRLAHRHWHAYAKFLLVGISLHSECPCFCACLFSTKMELHTHNILFSWLCIGSLSLYFILSSTQQLDCSIPTDALFQSQSLSSVTTVISAILALCAVNGIATLACHHCDCYDYRLVTVLGHLNSHQIHLSFAHLIKFANCCACMAFLQHYSIFVAASTRRARPVSKKSRTHPCVSLFVFPT